MSIAAINGINDQFVINNNSNEEKIMEAINNNFIIINDINNNNNNNNNENNNNNNNNNSSIIKNKLSLQIEINNDKITKKTNENGHEKNEEQEQDDEELITPTQTNLKTILEEKAFNKNNNKKITLEGRDDSSSGGSNSITDNILKRRPSAPSKLNVDTIKIDQTNYNKTKTNINVATKTISTSTPTSPVLPLVSPKIIKLRRSESFGKLSNKKNKKIVNNYKNNKNNNNDDNNSNSNSGTILPSQLSSSPIATTTTTTTTTTTPPSSSTSLLPPPFATISPKGRKWNPKTNGLKSASPLNSLPRNELDKDLLARLEQQNSQLPPQGSAEFLLARLEKQNELLDKDPKSVCIQSNVLKAKLETVQSLIDGINNNNDNDNNNNSIDDASQLKLLLKEFANNDDFIMTEEDKSKINDWDFWSALIQDYPSVATKLPHLLAAKLQNGCPPKLRSLIWQSMSQASSTYLETMYEQLLPESSPYERIIQRDLARTFPHVEMFKEENGNGQTMLWNVLKAYSLYDPLVGYCQGLGFLVGPLLMNMNETQAFCVFVRLMETYDMRTMFTLNMEGLQLRLYQFSSLLTQILPKLHAHFQLHAVQPAMFASQWFLSLFAYTYPLPLIMRIYDVVFAEGAPETIMRVAIALLKKNEERLLSFGEFEDLLDFLTSRLYESYDNEPTGLIKDAMELSTAITKAKLDQLDECYVKELEEQKKRAEKLVAVRFNGRFTIGNNKQSTKHEKKKDNIKITNNAANEVKKHEKSKRWSFTNLPTSRISFNNNNSSGSVNSISSNSSSGSNSNSNNKSNGNSKNNGITTNNGADPHHNHKDSVSSISSITSDISISSTDNTSFSPIFTNNSSVLHQQIEDLVTALSVLQKEHVDITAQLVSIKMEKMDLVTDNENLKNRLRGLEKENKRISSTLSISSVSSSSSLDNSKRNSLPKLSSRRTSCSSINNQNIINNKSKNSNSNNSAEDPDITPRPSTELTISHKGITKVEIDAAAKQKGKKGPERRSSESDAVKNPQRILLVPSFASMPRIFSSSSTSVNNASSTTSPTASLSSTTILTTPETSDNDNNNKNNNNNNNNSINETDEITDELVQTKMEKFDLMQENDELNRRIEELQSSLEISDEAQTKLKEKNSFLREEIERLKKRKVVSKDAKELKTVKKQNQIIIGENKKLKKEVETLRSKIKLIKDVQTPLDFEFSESDDSTDEGDSSRTDEDDDDEYSSSSGSSSGGSYSSSYSSSYSDTSSDNVKNKRLSIFDYFTGNKNKITKNKNGSSKNKNRNKLYDEETTTTDDDGASSNSQGYQMVSITCNGKDCEASKQLKSLEQDLIDVKLRLAESEGSKDILASQLDSLRSLVNTLTDNESNDDNNNSRFITRHKFNSCNSRAKPDKRTRTSSISIASFFGGGGS